MEGLQAKGPILRTPGSWLVRNLLTLWYTLYGFVLMVLKLKVLREFMGKKDYDPRSESRQAGEVVVITGGPRGIAYELAKKFLQLDFIVIMGCRDVITSQLKVTQIRQRGVKTGTIHLLPLNLKSLASTKEFAESVLKLTSRIDFLLNNAGIMMTPYECTEDGYEAQFQVNYLSHFLLTLLLLPVIKKTTKERDRCCRIVNTTSAYHLVGSIDFDHLETREIYVPPKCYFDSKLCQVMFANYLEHKLKEEQANIHVFSVHPGAIPTELWIDAGKIHLLAAYLLQMIMPSVENGADAILHATLSSSLEKKGGSYLEGLEISQSHRQADNADYLELLWRQSELLCQRFLPSKSDFLASSKSKGLDIGNGATIKKTNCESNRAAQIITKRLQK